jgi:DNA-binding beta-propeller fold protein YncE
MVTRCLIAAMGASLGVLGPAAAGWSTPSVAAASLPTSYITNSASDTVTVVSGTTITGTIRVGKGPVGIALTPDRTMAYVADYGFNENQSHTVTPLDLGSGRAGRPIKVGVGPMAVAVDSQKAVVTLEGTPAQPGHQVVVIDLATRKVSAPVEVGLNPESVAISPDGTTAYVAAFGSAQVTPVDLTTSPPTAESPIPLPDTSPRAIAVTANGQTAYVLDAAHATVIPISLGSRTVGTAVSLRCEKTGDPGCTPTAITMGTNGTTAYIAAAGSGDVLELAIPSLSVVHVLATGGYPDAVGLVPGWLVVANGAGDDLSVFHHGTHTVSPLSYPFGVAVVPGTKGGADQVEAGTDVTARHATGVSVGARTVPTGPTPAFYGVRVGAPISP